jgi:hypothetical protein
MKPIERGDMNLPNTYTLDTETIRLNAYRLLCLFYANKEIARLSDPDDRNDGASELERTFFSREMTHLLLNIAIGLRVLDDQMRTLTMADEQRQAYDRSLKNVNRHSCTVFDYLPLREACNKIIHANVVEPHDRPMLGDHELDHQNWLGWSEAVDQSSLEEVGAAPGPSVAWSHLSGQVRLGGYYRKKPWWHLLDVPAFVDAIYELFAGITRHAGPSR